MLRSRLRARDGFACVRVLVAVIILGNFTGLTLVWAREAQQAQARQTTINNLRQCVLAAHSAHDGMKRFPPLSGMYGPAESGTFHYHLLPFLKQLDLFERKDANGIVPAFLTSEDSTRANKGAGAVNFPVNQRLFHLNGGLGELPPAEKGLRATLGQITNGEGTAHTMLFANRYQLCGAKGGAMYSDPGKNAPGSPMAATFGASMDLWQRAPKQADCDPAKGTAVSFDPKTMVVAMCDGSVLTVSIAVSKATWQAAHTFRGNDLIGFDFWDIQPERGPKVPPPEVVSAWHKTGVSIGWMGLDKNGLIVFRWADPAKSPKSDDIPAFQVRDWRAGELSKLPSPECSFGLDFVMVKGDVSDAGLKELGGLKTLAALDLSGARVTDVGLKELTGLKTLRFLNLSGTQVTAAGVAELKKALPELKVVR